MSNHNIFFHETSEFSENQFAAAKIEKEAIQQIYNEFDDTQLKNDPTTNEYIILNYDVEISSIGEKTNFSPDALKSYTRKYEPKLKKYTFANNSLEPEKEIKLSSNDTKIIPAYINSQYIGELMQDQFYHIARQCFLINLVYGHFYNTENELNDEIKSIRKELDKNDSTKKVIVLLNDCNLELKKPLQKIKQGLDAVIDETNHFLKKIDEKGIIVVVYHKNYIHESVLIDQIIEYGEKFNIDKKLKEHFKNDMLLLNNKTILDEKDKGYTQDWTQNFIFPPKLVNIEKNKPVLKTTVQIKKMWEDNYKNRSQPTNLTLFSKPIVNKNDKLFFYFKIKEDETFYKIEFIIPHGLFEDQLYKDIIWISHKLLNDSTTQNQ